MPRLKKHVCTNFTVIRNDCLQDRNLSITDKGLLAVILSLPDGWNITVRGLAGILPDGVEKISNSLKRLIANGYVKREIIRVNGQIHDTIYHFCDKPVFKEKDEEEAKKAKTEKPKKAEKTEKKTENSEKLPSKKEKKEEKVVEDIFEEVFEEAAEKVVAPKEKTVDSPKEEKAKEVVKEKEEVIVQKEEKKEEKESIDDKELVDSVKERTKTEKREISKKFKNLSGKELRKYIAKEIFEEKKVKEKNVVSEDFFKRVVAIFADIIENNPEKREELLGTCILDVRILQRQTKKAMNPDIIIRQYFMEEGVFFLS